MVSAKWAVSFFVIIVTLFSSVTRAQLNNEEENGILITPKSDSAEEEGKDYCEEVCGNNPGVECNGDTAIKKEITCDCEDDDKAFDPSDKECKEDNCVKICGIPHGEEDNDELICIGRSPFGDVSCECKDKEMTFDASDKECKIDYCDQKCGNITCTGNKFDEYEIECQCPDKFQDFIEEEKICRVNYCKRTCGTDEGVTCNGDEYKSKRLKDCGCDDEDYVFYNKKCRKMCLDSDDCENEGTCKNDTKLCKCKTGTTGDMCEVITECTSGKLQNCRGDKGECVFKDGKAQCECPEGKDFYTKLGNCEDRCNYQSDCGSSTRYCNTDSFCECKDGYEGDHCDVITGCKTLAEKCKEIDTECIFDGSAPEKASCKCDYSYIYDRDNNICQHPFCYPNNPCKDGECINDNDSYSGYCKCSGDKFYNYKTEKCEELPDKCILKKNPCGQNYECSNGECKCKYEDENGECKPKFCSSNPCFNNAKCSDDEGVCYCEEGLYFTGNNCLNLTCNLKEFKTTCPCPVDTKRVEKNEECVPIKDKEACSKDCGYGVCILENDEEICKCFHFAVHKAGKCRLNENLCPNRSLYFELMECFCYGRYIKADDGITCRLRTCEDKEAQEDCATRAATCTMNWKSRGLWTPAGYDCECPKGYAENLNGKCADPCSIEKNIIECAKTDRLCYNYPSKDREMTCDCPPIFQEKNCECTMTCTKKADNVYLISNIPVLKKKYEIPSGINKVLLNIDLIQSMESTFSSDLFDYGYLYDYRIVGDILNCSIWINFKSYLSQTEEERIKLVPKQFSEVCDDCDENAVVWPPNLLLSEVGLQETIFTRLSFCSDEVKDLICGKGATCWSDKCTCKEGFKIIGETFREIGHHKIQRCEDIDECASGSPICTENTTCVNTLGSYKCACKEGFQKVYVSEDPENDKNPCYDMCASFPCVKGKCVLKEKTFDCQCQPGYGGPLCDRLDDNYYRAKRNTVIVGSILGLLLLVVASAFLYYVLKMRKKSDSQEDASSPEVNNTEMMVRRNIRHITKPLNAMNPGRREQQATYVPRSSQ